MNESEQLERSVLMERVSGATCREIAAKHQMSPETARKLARRVMREHADEIELALLAGTKTPGEVGYTVLVPLTADGTLDGVLIDYARWICDELRERGVKLRTSYWAKPDGIAIGLDMVLNEKEETR